MNFSKTIISIAVASSMVGAAGYVYAQQTDSSTTNREASAGINNPNTPNTFRGEADRSSGTTETSGQMNNTGMKDNSGTNKNSGMSGTTGFTGSSSNPTTRDGTARDGMMSNNATRDGSTGQSSDSGTGERKARADRN